MSAARAAAPEVDAALRARLAAVVDEGQEIWERFDLEVRQNAWHPFVAADYERVLQTLVEMRAPGLRFLEWGSATGIITIMADLLGYEAYGIELDGALVTTARGLAEKFGSGARFAEGSFIPTGYRWKARDGDHRLATIGDGASGYLELRHPLDDFDIVYAFPWNGEEPMMRDLMKAYGARDAVLLLNSATVGVRTFRHGKQQP
ncbi:MAG TPA: hypothetical protein VE913_15790 [Longimicrobium sp.]|nr:hypothetical protein [Longimicrobium sp.]